MILRRVIDAHNDTFGIRSIAWDAAKGLLLNGVPTKVKGFANHQDFAGVGVAVPDALQTYRVWRIKQMGANAWRTAHNPPTPALLDECDKQGLLVWDENHRNEQTPDMLDDLRSLVLRDRNHPSIVMWSLCNEALCGPGQFVNLQSCDGARGNQDFTLVRTSSGEIVVGGRRVERLLGQSPASPPPPPAAAVAAASAPSPPFSLPSAFVSAAKAFST